MQFEGYVVACFDRSEYTDKLYRAQIRVKEFATMGDTFTIKLDHEVRLGGRVRVSLEFFGQGGRG